MRDVIKEARIELVYILPVEKQEQCLLSGTVNAVPPVLKCHSALETSENYAVSF